MSERGDSERKYRWVASGACANCAICQKVAGKTVSEHVAKNTKWQPGAVHEGCTCRWVEVRARPAGKSKAAANNSNFLADAGFIILIWLLPFVGIPVIMVKKKDWWEKKWVRIASFSWMALLFLAVATTPRQPELPAQTNNTPTAEKEDTYVEPLSAEAEIQEELSNQTEAPEEKIEMLEDNTGSSETQPGAQTAVPAPSEPHSSTTTPTAQSSASTPATQTTQANENTTTTQPDANASGTGGNRGGAGIDYEMEGYCEDGTPVKGIPSLKGKANACYGHGGWVINHE